MALNNSDILTQILREQQVIDQTSWKSILEISNSKPIHLYEIGKLTKLLLLGSRYQVILYTVFGLAYISLEGKGKFEKLQDDLKNIDTTQKYYDIKKDKIESKIQKLKIVTALFGITSIFGLLITHRMGKLIPKSIFWLPTNQIQLTFYNFLGFKKQIVAPINDFQLFQSSSKLNKTVMMKYKNQKLSTIGTGISHSNLLKYLLSSK